MARLIDTEVLKCVKFHGVTDWTPTEETSYQRGWNDAIDAIIDNAPTVDPVKHGHWKYDNQYHWYRACCSECGYCRVTDIEADRWNEWKYCPNCGAKMTGESNE